MPFFRPSLVNVLTVLLAHPAVNIRSRKNEIFYDIKDYFLKKPEKKRKKRKNNNRPFIILKRSLKKKNEKKLEKKRKKKAILCQYFIRS